VLLDTDTDYFSFTLASDRPMTEIVEFSLTRLSPNATGTIDWRLLDSSLTEIDSGSYSSTLEAAGLTAGTYYLELTRTSTSFNFGGVYEVTAATSSSVCGDGTVEGVEECDDGNTMGGDGCSAMCTVETPDASASSSPGTAIPDDDLTGIDDTVTISGCSTISNINVDIDITHTWRGDIDLTLTSPAGTAVILWQDTGGSADDLIGNFPNSLTPDGSLSAFAGETGNGTWTLNVVDDAGFATGTLNSWGVNLYCQ
jgi:cysteine-rich repeat protein